MQPLISLITTESEYIALSAELIEVIPITHDQRQYHLYVPAHLHAHPRPRQRRTEPANPHHVYMHQSTGRVVIMGPYQYQLLRIHIHHHMS